MIKLNTAVITLFINVNFNVAAHGYIFNHGHLYHNKYENEHFTVCSSLKKISNTELELK